MSGNVWEWCLSKWGAPHSTTVDATHELRVMRGGSFLNHRRTATSSVRDNPTPRNANLSWAFRVGVFPPL